MADKLDVRKAYDHYRAKRGEFRILDVPDQTYLMVDGHGDPNTSASFRDAVEALFPVAYTLKFASKRDHGRDYVVPPLEGLWWADEHEVFTTARDKTRWSWTLLLLVPEWLDEVAADAAVEAVRAKATGAKPAPARLDDVRVEVLSEGRCVQTLHVGSFDEEGPVLAELHERVVPEQGLRLRGTHHEIYLTDLRRGDPAKQRTILRQPVTAA